MSQPLSSLRLPPPTSIVRDYELGRNVSEYMALLHLPQLSRDCVPSLSLPCSSHLVPLSPSPSIIKSHLSSASEWTECTVDTSSPSSEAKKKTRPHEDIHKQANSLTRIFRYDDNGGDDDFGGARSLQLHINVYTYICTYLPGPAAFCALHHHFLLLTVLRSAGRLKSFTSHGARDEHTATNKGLRVNNLGT